jgi:hypothetical protein
MVEYAEPDAYKSGKLKPGTFGDIDAFFAKEKQRSQKEEARRAATFKQDMTEFLVAQSLGADISQVALRRYIPTAIYVATTTEQSKSSREIALAFSALLAASGFEQVDDSMPFFGSIGWRSIHRSKSRKTARQLNERLIFVEDTMERAFIRLGAQVNGRKVDRAEMERTKAESEAELKKLEAECEQAKAEAEKAKAEREKILVETKKLKLEAKLTFLDCVDKFARAIVKASAAFVIVIGTLHLSAPAPPVDPKPAVAFRIESRQLGPNDKEVTGGMWLQQPEKKTSGIDEARDLLDSE